MENVNLPFSTMRFKLRNLAVSIGNTQKQALLSPLFIQRINMVMNSIQPGCGCILVTATAPPQYLASSEGYNDGLQITGTRLAWFI